MRNIRPSPSLEQQRIIESTARFIAIDGNAGSAKTTSLAMKADQAVRGGLRPSALVVLTYTQAAVLAFRQRLRLLGFSREHVAALRIQTFDDLCHELLCRRQGECVLLGKPNREVQETVALAIERARGWAVARGFDESFDIVGDGALAIPSLLRSFMLLKGTLALHFLGSEFRLTPASACDVGINFTEAAVLREYERLRLEGGSGRVLDGRLAPRFRLPGDPVYDMVRLVEADEPSYSGMHPLAGLLQLVLVDEGHDINAALFAVMQHLVQHNPVRQLLVVGDPDQVLHSEAGADAAYMGEAFEHGIGPLTRLPLTLCRRFGESIAEALRLHASKPYEFEASRKSSVQICRIDDIARLAALIEGELEVGKSESGMAVLMRQPGDAVRLEIELAQRGLLVETRGFGRLFDRPEILLVRTLFAWVTGSLSTLANAPIRSILSALNEFTGCLSHELTRKVVVCEPSQLASRVLGSPELFKQHAENGFCGAQDALNPVIYFSSAEARGAIRRLVQVFESGVEPRTLSARIGKLELSLLLKRGFVTEEDVDDAMVAIRSFASSAASHESLGLWLEQMANLEFAESASRRSSSREAAVVHLYSIPAAKSLEFSSVVIPHVDARWFDGRGQEDRNLFYVAASRARERLTITYRSTPSSYLEAFRTAADTGLSS